MWVFYTYLHRRPDGSIFYVGKGSGRRAWSRGSRSKAWRAAAAEGHSVEICATWPTEDESFQHECLLIAVLRDLGHQLVNITDGGHGVSGHRHSEATRSRLSERHREIWSDPAFREKMMPLRRFWTDEMRANQSRSQRLVWADEEKVGARRIAILDSMKRPEVRAKKSMSQRAAQRKPEVVEKQRIANARNRLAGIVTGKPPKPVVCADSGVVFESAAAAARALGLRPQNVARAARGERAHAGGMRFQFITPAAPASGPPSPAP